MSRGELSRWQKLWAELEPIVNHALVVLVLELSLLSIGYITHQLELFMPRQRDVLSFVETIDVWTSLFVLSLFAAYTVLLVLIRLVSSIMTELRHARGSLGVGPDEP